MSHYASPKLADLKIECKARGLAISGIKADLVNRLLSHDIAKHAAATTANDIPSLADYDSDNDPQGTARIKIHWQKAAFLKEQNDAKMSEDERGCCV